MTNKTPCRNLGYYVGNKFEVLEDYYNANNGTSTMVSKGDIVHLYEDDGSDFPRFKAGDGNLWWIHLDNVKKYDMVPGVHYPQPTFILTTTNKYVRTISGVDIDVYDILKAWNVTCPATQHAIKKLLMPGQRGSKSKLNDLEEAYAAIQRAIELEAF